MTVAALSVAALADTSAGSSAHGHTTAVAKHHRQRVSHFNVARTHSPKLLRELAGHPGKPKNGVTDNTPGAGLAGAAQGVDVAAYQHPGGGSINWRRVAKSGIKFAAIKATEGAYYRNPFALSDLAEAKSAGLSVMAYVFAVPNGNGSSASPVAQADYLVKYLKQAGGTPPPIMLDIEYNPYGAECYGLSQSAMKTWISQFSGEIAAKTGENPIIYGPVPWWQDCTGGASRFSQFPLWVPDWTTASKPLITAGWSTYAFWQYSSAGTVRGIDAPGNTDLDQMNPAAIPLLDPGAQSTAAGSSVNLQIMPAGPVSSNSVSFSAAGLPPGTSISPAGQITGWPTAVGKFPVMVSATDSQGQSGSVSFTWNVTGAPTTGPTGQVQSALGVCLTAGGSNPTAANNKPAASRVVIKACTSSGSSSTQDWTYAQDGTLRIDNLCLTIPTAALGAPLGLAQCGSTQAQQWRLIYPRALNPARGPRPIALLNPWSGMCLADPGFSTTNGTRVVLWPCNGYTNQSWALPAGPVTSQIPGMCLDDLGDQTANGTKIVLSTCDGAPEQAWQAQTDGTLRINDKCLDVEHGATATGSVVDLYACNGTKAQQWHLVPAGAGITLVNPGSGLCLADPGDTTAEGTQLVIDTCPGSDPGMAWQAS
ncbi:MAG TPA: ricin-type beta-trefoil lectin domain protein [Streptosporangiaceae bacterium]|nr:ricin-type beta-trefoil lectin domain protein [Streptosporangiaceae bacterium]